MTSVETTTQDTERPGPTCREIKAMSDYDRAVHFFPSDVAEHEMTVLMNEGIYRHLRFAVPDDSHLAFEVVTAPNILIFFGDMGSFAFNRHKDNFHLFRGQKTDGMYGYWAEKLQAVDKGEGYHKWSQREFEESVYGYVDEDWEFEDDEQKEKVRADVKVRVIDAAEENGYNAYATAVEYKSEFGHELTDFFDCNMMEYTYRYVWCCLAIVWAIDRFDELRTKIDGQATKSAT